MQFTSFMFFLFVAGSVVLYHLSPSVRFRKFILLVANFLFIASFASDTLALLPLAAFVVVGYACVRFVPAKEAKLSYGAVLLAFLFLFVWLKQYAVISAVPHLHFVYLAVGLSYILFRVLHLIIDTHDGILECPPFLDYLLYTTSFLTFVSGPIQRYPQFEAQLEKPMAVDETAAFRAFSRIILGFAKIALFAELAHVGQGQISSVLLSKLGTQSLGVDGALAFATAAALYFFYLYLNFSGYMDIVIGIGRLFGWSVPENFDKPLSSANFIDLWSRWHITLSEWFKTYFFNPLLRAMVRQWDTASLAPYLGVVAFFVTFLLLGAWHGASLGFLLCGFLFAIGVSVNKLYQVEMTKRLGKRRYRALAQNPVYRYFCCGLTLAYFALALTTFWLSLGQIGALVAALGLQGLLLTVSLLTFAMIIVAAVDSRFVTAPFVGRVGAALEHSGFVTRTAALGFCVAVLVLAVPWINSPPEFVYKAF